MKVKLFTDSTKAPSRATELAAGFDIYMPEAGIANGTAIKVPLGFAANIPAGYAAIIAPRSGVGFKHGLEVNNTIGLIDADYTKEWFASVRTKSGIPFSWEKGERILQFFIVPVFTPEIEIVEDLDTFEREGGLGSTGK